MPDPPPPPEREDLHASFLHDAARRRGRRLWMLWSFLPALLAPVLFWLALTLSAKFNIQSGRGESLLMVSALLSPFWILFCVTRIHKQQTPGSPGSTLADGCGLFLLLLLANFFAGLGLILASCAAIISIH